MKRILFVLGLALVFISVNVFADACKSEDMANLQKTANNIKVNYEIIEKKETVTDTNEYGKSITSEVVNYTIKTTVYNITKDVYLVQKSEEKGTTNTINYADTVNGKYEIISKEIYDYEHFKYEVYSNLSTCDTTLIRTISYTKPKKNPYASFEVCVNNPDVPACQTFITQDTGVREGNLAEYVQNYVKNNGNKTDNKIDEETTTNNFLKDNLLYIVIGGGVVLIGVVVGYIIVSKKRSAL